MKVVGLAHKADGGCVCIEHGGQHIVVLGADPGPLGHAEGGEGCAGPGRFGEKGTVGRVRARPAAFDIVEPERVERLRDLLFFRGGELHALRLLPVAQGGVEEVEAFFSHGMPRFLSPAQPWRLRHGQPPAAPLGGGYTPTRGRELDIGRRGSFQLP